MYINPHMRQFMCIFLTHVSKCNHRWHFFSPYMDVAFNSDRNTLTTTAMFKTKWQRNGFVVLEECKSSPSVNAPKQFSPFNLRMFAQLYFHFVVCLHWSPFWPYHRRKSNYDSFFFFHLFIFVYCSKKWFSLSFWSGVILVSHLKQCSMR